MNLYVVRNKEGKFFRAIGYGGSGGNWVDSLDRAKFYPKRGQAASRVTFFFKHYPQFGCPEILEFDLNVADAVVLNMEAVTQKNIKKIEATKLKRQLADKERERESLARASDVIQRRLAQLG